MLLTKLRLYNKLKTLKEFFTANKYYSEAFFAYCNKLPDRVEVSWERDNNYIIGTVKTDDREFVTQGISAGDFIEMVNESLIVSYDIPRDYADIVKKAKVFVPSAEELEKLRDPSIKSANFGIKRLELKLA